MAKHLTPNAISKIHAFHASGMNAIQIAKRLNRSAPTIYNALKNANGAEPVKTAEPKADLSSIEARWTIGERAGSGGNREAIAVLAEAV